MKIFSWVVNKISGRQETSRFGTNSCAAHRATMSDCREDEFSDWPQSLLAIGTFGNKEFKEAAQAQNFSEDTQSTQDGTNFTEEEVDKIQREFEMLLANSEQPTIHGSNDDWVASQKPADVPDNEKNRDQLIDNKIIISRARDLLANNRSALKPRSIASLLKMIFICKGGFTTSIPELRTSFPQSRMEKFLKAVLQKKIRLQNSTTTVTRRYLDRKPDEKEINKYIEDAMQDIGDDGATWVKTDSEYIVLEM